MAKIVLGEKVLMESGSNALTYNLDTDCFGMIWNEEWKDVIPANFTSTYIVKNGVLDTLSILGAPSVTATYPSILTAHNADGGTLVTRSADYEEET